MDNPWVTLFLLALAAGFLPWQFSAVILILRKEHGLGKAIAFAGGITFWRLLIGVALAFVLAGGLIVVDNGSGPILEFIRSGFEAGAERVRNRQGAMVDILLILSGTFLLVRSIRAGIDESDPDAPPPRMLGTLDSISVRRAFGFGVVWMAVSVAQWTFLIAGVEQILEFDGGAALKLFAFVTFIVISSLLILMPVMLYAIRPELAQARLAAVEGKLNVSMRYLMMALQVGIGIYLLWRGLLHLPGE